MNLFDTFKKKKTSAMYLYTEEQLDEYEKFIMDNFGEYKEVFHEIVSPDIHLDIIIVPPTEDANYYKLITMGMGAYKMNVPDELSQYKLERAELVLYLPPTWNIKSDKEEDYWPISYLKFLARMPINNNTWLGFGHTVGSDKDDFYFASNTKFCGMLLLNSCNLAFERLDLNLNDLGKINFYQLYPLYEEELEYKRKNGAKGLLNLIDDEDIMPILNINRKNYGKIEE